ncbi:Oxidoreductase vrtI [Drechslerella dactyloides]|uniref:Oxidoreductase vrtI n=1 Tax=Drechslerella dactyloides TaxID=74499 RepID=A0AAD6IXR3_DREDA|nr:Oxidoreductase vrtI [Drechslerella dactyloides]
MDTKILTGDARIDVVRLDTISLKRLESGNTDEFAKLLSAAQSVGVFQLDFQGSEFGDVLWERVGEIYYATQQYFDQDARLKQEDMRVDQKPSQDKGYKFCESDETFEMAYDELVKGDLKLPETLHHSRYTMKYFSEICHSAGLTILRSLSIALPASLPFEDAHRKGKSSDSGLKIISEPCIEDRSKVIENKHTDSGSLTFSFYNDWGIHVQLRDGSWGYTAAVEGCAVINVADSLEWLSDGKLRSPLHRVTQPTDGAKKRYFLTYFLRPEYTFKDLGRRA